MNIRRQLKETIISDVKSVKSPSEPEKKVDLGFLPEYQRLKTAGFSDKEIDAYYKKNPPASTPKLDLGFLPDQPQILNCYFLSLKLGWIELSLLALLGFASPWFIYVFIRWVVIAFIVGGFKDKSLKGGEPD